SARPWVVLKYGGTSVASAEAWSSIVQRTKQLLPDHRVWLVVSAVSQVSNRLDLALQRAPARQDDDTPAWLASRHHSLMDELQLGPEARAETDALLAQVGDILQGVRL